MPKKEHKTLPDEAISLNEELEDRLANELACLKANAIEEPKKPSKATVEGALKFLNKKGYRVTLSSPPAKQY